MKKDYIQLHSKSEKLFFTYQPKTVLDDIIKNGAYRNTTNYGSTPAGRFIGQTFPSIYGFQPIFCVPLDNLSNFLCDSFWTHPNCPEVLILFKSSDYIDLSLNFVHANLRGDLKAEDTNFAIREYTVPSITKENLVSTFVIPKIEDFPIEIAQLEYLMDSNLHKVVCNLTGDTYKPIQGDRMDMAVNVLFDLAKPLVGVEHIRNPSLLKITHKKFKEVLFNEY